MYKQLAAIYHKLADNPIVAACGKLYLRGLPIGNLRAFLRMKKQAKYATSDGGPIVVVFLQQNKVNWDCIKDLYEMLSADSRFDAHILAVDEQHDLVPDAAYSNLVSLYGPNNVIKAEQPDGLFDLKTLSPDYVFLPRPYDQYLPVQYRSAAIASYARVVYIPYGFLLSKNVEGDVLSGRFCRNVALMLADSSHTAALQKKRFPKSHALGLRRTTVTGYPYFARFTKQRQQQRSQNKPFRIMWTPRWANEQTLGGSNFMQWRESVFSFVEAHEEISLIFRPHPFMFEHLLSTGKMTKDEISSLLLRIDKHPRMSFDDTPALDDSFSATDLLLTDISSIIIPYMLTGKPIIYCETGAELNPIGCSMRNALYYADSFADAKMHIESISAGNDPMRIDRDGFVKSELLANGSNPSIMIINCLLEDFNRLHSVH